MTEGGRPRVNLKRSRSDIVFCPPARAWHDRCQEPIMTSIDAEDVAKLRRIVMSSPIIGPIMRRWSSVALPDCWLVAGGVVQTVWNDAFGFAPEDGIADIDLVYFDTGDLSEATEHAYETRVRQAFAD